MRTSRQRRVAKVNGLRFVGKLSSRSQKVCYSLLNKVGGTKADPGVKQGDRVALVYAASEAGGLCAGFFGCLFAGVVPVAIDSPTSKEVTYNRKQ